MDRPSPSTSPHARQGGLIATLVASVNTEQNPSSGPCTLDRILLTNSDTNPHTLLVEDGDASLGTYTIGASASVSLDFGGLPILTNLAVTPSDTHVSALIIFH